MLKYLKKFLTKNLWIKIFCLFAATVLWVYIAAGQNTVAKYPGSIKIKAINVPSGLMAIYDNKTVEIKIMAEPGVWSKLSSDTFSAYIDLSGHSEGTYEFPVNVVSSTPGVTIVEKNPERIIVSLESILTKDVAINKKIEGSAGEGLVAGNIELSPDKVTVRGPKSIVEGISEATAIIKLNGETEKFSKNVPVVALDETGEAIDNVEFNPAEITATVPIVKASNNKTVGIKVKTTGSPKAGYYLSSVTTNPSTVDITGPANLLTDVNYIETAPIDLSDLSAVTEKEVSLNVKSGIALQVGSPTKVKVKMVFAQAETSKEVVPTVNPLNLSNYRISSMNPATIRVVCSGRADLIDKLSSQNVILNLDFKDKTIPSNLSLNFDISAQNFVLPDGISITSVIPSSIALTLENK